MLTNDEEPEDTFIESFKRTLDNLDLMVHNNTIDAQTIQLALGDLHEIYDNFIERDQDFHIAAELGKVLVEKNQALEEAARNIQYIFQQQLEEALAQNEALQNDLDNLREIAEEYKARGKRAEEVVRESESDARRLRSEKEELEAKLVRISEETIALEQAVSHMRSQIRQHAEDRSKARELLDEVERCRTELVELKKRETILRKENGHLKALTKGLHQMSRHVFFFLILTIFFLFFFLHMVRQSCKQSLA